MGGGHGQRHEECARWGTTGIRSTWTELKDDCTELCYESPQGLNQAHSHGEEGGNTELLLGITLIFVNKQLRNS